MTLRDVDVDYEFDDPDDGWFGQALPVDAMLAVHRDPTVDHGPPHQAAPHPVAEPSAETSSKVFYEVDDRVDGHWSADVVEPQPDLEDSYDTDRWHVGDLEAAMAEQAASNPTPAVVDTEWAPAPTDRTTVARPSPWEPGPSRSGGAWDFHAPPTARPRGVLVAAIAAAVLVAGVATAVLLLRDSAPAVDDSTVAPVTPSAQPVPTSAAPALSPSAQAPAPPPPLPPPPPPPADPVSPPAQSRYTPPRSQSSSESRPETNATRTPITRPPMSFAPPPSPPSQRDSSTPGDAPKRRGWGF